jgi:hypothetical protein
MSLRAFLSPGTRFDASLEKATLRPLAESEGASLDEFPSTPDESTLTLRVVRSWRSRRKTSVAPFPSRATSRSASLRNAANRPSAESTSSRLAPFALAPPPAAPAPPADPTLPRASRA